jgi:hypothetical protein
MQKVKLGFPISLLGQNPPRYLGGIMQNRSYTHKKIRRFLNLAQRLIRLVIIIVEIIEEPASILFSYPFAEQPPMSQSSLIGLGTNRRPLCNLLLNLQTPSSSIV